MQLQEILSQLETTPIHYNVIMIVAFILAVIFFLCILAYSNGHDESKFVTSVIALTVSLFTAVGLLIYTETAKDSAIKEAKITRSSDKIHIESNSEFMKSADLDVVAEKDGYIYVEFENTTYRIEDLSKKGN